jgi:two-component system LytT family sensor kinase
MKNPYRQLPIPFRTLALASVVLVGLQVAQAFVRHSYEQPSVAFRWDFHLISNISAFGVWALLSPLLFRIARGLADDYSAPRVLAHLGLGTVIAAGHRLGVAYLMSLIYFALGAGWYDPFSFHSVQGMAVEAFSSFVAYWVLVGALLAFAFHGRLRDQQVKLAQTEQALSVAKLEALRQQLRPHFLFNTLNAISALVDDDKRVAQTMISRLAYLLRTILERDQQPSVSLQDELDYVRAYLGIEQARFGDRLHVEFDVAPEVQGASVPNLILQPLVENAIKHGFYGRSEPGTIRVSGHRRGERLELVIADDGRGSSKPSRPSGTGVGLENLRLRLQQIYSGEAVMVVDPGAEGEGFVVRITLPFLLHPATLSSGKQPPPDGPESLSGLSARRLG